MKLKNYFKYRNQLEIQPFQSSFNTSNKIKVSIFCNKYYCLYAVFNPCH